MINIDFSLKRVIYLETITFVALSYVTSVWSTILSFFPFLLETGSHYVALAHLEL